MGASPDLNRQYWLLLPVCTGRAEARARLLVLPGYQLISRGVSGMRIMTDTSDLARALAALRPRTTATCEVCGAAFETWQRKTQQARTCSPRCRQQLFRDRRKAAR